MNLSKFPSIESAVLDIPHWHWRLNAVLFEAGAAALCFVGIKEAFAGRLHNGKILGSLAITSASLGGLYIEVDLTKSELEEPEID